MKAVKIFALLSLLGIGVSSCGSYRAACMMSDLIRCYEDHLVLDSIESSQFEEMKNTFLFDTKKNKPINLGKYIYCY